MAIEGGPLYAYYKKEKAAHYVVVTGVDTKNNIVYTNNPLNKNPTQQSFEEFRSGYANTNGTSNNGMQLWWISTTIGWRRGYE